MSPAELVEKLSALVPPLRANMIVYRGGLAGHAAWRSEVAPKPLPEERALLPMPKIGGGGTWMLWADVLAGAFHVS